ncbi:hypothetical protein V8E36_007501 [Tilletia maclaganii]
MHSTAQTQIGRQIYAALRRSIETARDETVKVMRFEALESRANLSQHALPLYSFTTPPLAADGSAPTPSRSSSATLPLNRDFATGSDIDIGGLSTVRFGWDPSERAARFWGTLSSDIPRGARIERSGYAAFRNKNRSTLFGTQTWDTTVHPYLAIKVRNRLGAHPSAVASSASPSSSSSRPSSISSSSSSAPSLRSATDRAFERVHAGSDTSAIIAHAVHALGLKENEPPGPRFFVNIQTDGPITSDLFQHRLFLDANKLDEWQTVVIPFDSFVLTNTGTVSLSPLTMMREKIRTIGISAVLDVPAVPQSAARSAGLGSKASARGSESGPRALRKRSDEVDASASSGPGEAVEDDWGADGNLQQSTTSPVVRGSKRGRSFPFDLAIEQIYAVGDPEDIEAASSPRSEE